MINDQSNAVSGEPELKKKLPANLLLKRNSRDKSKIYKAKRLLIAGTSPGLVALMLRLPLETVTDLFDASYNPISRQLKPKTRVQQSQQAAQLFKDGASLADICSKLGHPLFTVTQLLSRAGVSDHDITSRMPPPDHQLMVEYAATVERGRTRERKGHRAIKI